MHHPLLVTTAHIHWDPEFCDVKLIQTMMLMNEIKNIIEEASVSFRPGSSLPDAGNIPLILCGDLNSLPESGKLHTAGHNQRYIAFHYILDTVSGTIKNNTRPKSGELCPWHRPLSRVIFM